MTLYNPYDRAHGTSGYVPTQAPHRRGEEPKASPPKPQRKTKEQLLKTLKGFFKKSEKSLARRLLRISLLVLGFGLLCLWLWLGEFRFLLTKAPALTGFPFGNRTYLVLFQNNYELRPTGGFISTFGTLEFSHGLYKGIEFQDVYGPVDDHDYIEPPLVLSALLSDENYQGHTFRDANFDPDFTKTAEDIIGFYQLTNPDAEIDGVIAADFHFLEQLVALYEPLYIQGYELTEQNLFETLSSKVSDIDRRNEEALAERKSITGPLVKSIITKTLILPWRINNALDLLTQGFDEKHVLATFNRNGLEKIMTRHQWNGALPQSDAGDFLAINNANYGGMKSNRYLTQDVKYELDISEELDVLGNPVVAATVTLTLSHEGGWNIPLSGLYKGYLRTMIPLGSRVIRGGEIDEERSDVQVLGDTLTLEPGDEITFTYQYELPEYVWVEDTYHLHLHKQPGTDADHYSVVVKAPQGLSFNAQHFDVRENLAFYEGPLLTDMNLSFSLVEDSNPPRIVMHEITALNEVTLVFNEAVSTDYAGDALNYTLEDLNWYGADRPDLQATDELSIASIRVDGAAVILTTTGMTPQVDERYSLTLRGLRDNAGNVIEPNPRTVTVIQDDDFSVGTELSPEADTGEQT